MLELREVPFVDVTFSAFQTGVDVNAVFGTTHIYASELEYAIPGYIPPGDIIGAMQVGADGKLTGQLFLHRNFNPNAG